MHKLQATEQGLLIPSEWLTGLPRDMVLRRIADTLIIETESRAHARERLLDMMQRLRNAAEALGIPSDAEIRELVDQARAGNARHR